MKVLDLFSGLGGWSDPARTLGYDVFTIDNDPTFGADAVVDVADTEAGLAALPWRPDLILASPPCNAFSMMSNRHYFMPGHGAPRPKNEKGWEALRLVDAT